MNFNHTNEGPCREKNLGEMSPLPIPHLPDSLPLLARPLPKRVAITVNKRDQVSGIVLLKAVSNNEGSS